MAAPHPPPDPPAVPRRLAVVTGGGTGIGRAVARELLAGGDEVLLVGRREDVLTRAERELAGAVPGGRVTSVVADAADPAQLPRVVQAVETRGGTVDVVVANAGAPARRDAATLADVAAAWSDAYRANVLTAVLLVEALTPMLRRPGGRVVLVSSAAALQGNATPAYAAAKAALHGWVLTLADRLGRDGITANVVAPGFTDGTELVAGRIPPERRAVLLGRIAAGRPAEPEEIGAVVRMVAEPAASYLNGQVIAVDGGVRATP